MERRLPPIYLLSDSELLFWRDNGRLFLDQVRSRMRSPRPRAAYVGASNGDRPEFFVLFQSAFESVGVTDCHMIPSVPTAVDQRFLESADLILMAGGNAELGWRTFRENGLRELIPRRHGEGAVLIGISAGAVQLGLGCLSDEGESLIGTFGLVPFCISAHEDDEQWPALRRMVALHGGSVSGLGLPRGAGAALHSKGLVEAVRKPMIVLSGGDQSPVQRLRISLGAADD